MVHEVNKNLYHRWLEMWNGNLKLAEEIVSPNCVVHRAPTGLNQTEYRGPQGIVQMIEQGRSPFSEETFTLEVGPIIQEDMLAARWKAEAVYKGGIPGTTAPAGTEITFHGIDLMRVRNGKIVEYWVSTDDLHFMMQLGVEG